LVAALDEGTANAVTVNARMTVRSRVRIMSPA
jgi:hypothetical protein